MQSVLPTEWTHVPGPQCVVSDVKIFANEWRDGSAKCLEPCKLHGIASAVILEGTSMNSIMKLWDVMQMFLLKFPQTLSPSAWAQNWN